MKSFIYSISIINKMQSDILKITDIPLVDKTIERYEFHEYADAVALTNNGLMHLFSQISYSLSNQEIEMLFHPGQATTMLGLLKYPNDFQLAQGLNQLWYKDSTATAVIADNS